MEIDRGDEFAKFALTGNENDPAAGLGSGLKGEVNDTPGEVELPKPITTAEPKRVRHFAIDSEKAVTEHEIALKAFSSNRGRLKAGPLAREAGRE